MNRVLPLVAIEIFVWLGLLLSTFLISKVVYTIDFGNGTIFERIVTQTTRVVVSGSIILVWLFAWKNLTNRYLWRALSRRKATA